MKPKQHQNGTDDRMEAWGRKVESVEARLDTFYLRREVLAVGADAAVAGGRAGVDVTCQLRTGLG